MLTWLGPIIAAILSGGAAGWVSSYLNLDVAIRKSRSERRRQQIDFWRKELLAGWQPTERSAIPAKGHAVCQNPAYDSLRPHLSSDLVEDLEGKATSGFNGQTVIVLMEGDIDLRRRMVREIGDLEKEWKLI